MGLTPDDCATQDTSGKGTLRFPAAERPPLALIRRIGDRTMHRIRQSQLPFAGSSHHFVGADQGDVNISVFLLSAAPGRGPGPHRHPYDEV